MPERDDQPALPVALSESSFWDASLRLYQRPGMQARLLELQDTQGCNVNLELLKILLAEANEAVTDALNEKDRALLCATSPLSDTEYQHLHTAVMAFSEAHTQKVRALRRELTQSKVLDQKSREQLKTQLLAAELSLEKQEQAILIRALRHLRSPS